MAKLDQHGKTASKEKWVFKDVEKLGFLAKTILLSLKAKKKK